MPPELDRGRWDVTVSIPPIIASILKCRCGKLSLQSQSFEHIHNKLTQRHRLCTSVPLRQEIKALPLSVMEPRGSLDLNSLLCVVCLLSSLSVCSMSLNLCLPEGCLVNLSLSPAQKSSYGERNEGCFIEIFSTVSQGIKSLTPVAPN